MYRETLNQLAILALLLVLGSCQEKEKEKEIQPDENQTITIASLLTEMTDRDAVAKFPANNFRLKQASSYNRASKNPKDTVGWFNNIDRFESIRIDTINGKPEWVLMDHMGPGAIVRTWMPFENPKEPNTTNHIKIYLDGQTEPVLEGNMLGLLNDDGLFPFPLSHKSIRSSVSFFPIPFAKGCKITVTEKPFFYQFTYREYDDEADIKTFTMEDFKKEDALVKEVCQTLLSPKDTTTGKALAFKSTLGKNEEKSIALPDGTAAVRALSIKLGGYADSLVTRSVVLKMEFDGQETVWCPVGDFFGSGIGLNPYQGWYRTVAEDGTLSSRWVMPYQKSGKISIVNLGEEPVDIDLKATVGDWEWDENSMYFNAAWHGQYPVPTRPFSDWNYVTLKGRGVYVGDALTIWNPVKRWWGEGDEKIWVDGEDFPSIFGTGTEDYYAYSWGGMSNDFYEHPFHAQPHSNVYNKLHRKTEAEFGDKNTQGYSTETRSRALDGMPFGSSLQLDMEVWAWTEDVDMEYGVGVYWYGDANTTSNRQPDPKGLVELTANKKEPIDD